MAGGHMHAPAANGNILNPGATQYPPITHLLWHLSHFKALAAERELANVAIAPLVRQLPFDQASNGELVSLLEKFGWHPIHDFTTTLDLAGLKGALQKYKYIKMGPLGSGSYGVVYKAQNRETQELLAIKRVRFSIAEHGLSDSTIREISTLRELRHDNIVKLKDIIATANGQHVHLVLEFLDCDLRQYLDTHPEASEIGRIKSVVLQILRGIRHAHMNSIMHRDLKPQNVLIGVAKGQVKLTDFGLARCFLPNSDRAYTERVVTLYYRAPELLLGSPCYTSAVDLWSVGCIMAEMINFEPLFKADTEIGLLFRIFEKLGTPNLEVWKDLRGLTHFSDDFPNFPPKPMRQLVPRLAGDPAGLDLLSRLLTYDPSRRITARQALEHPWFQGVVV
ncbi:cyclin dependent kinase [Volvox carteri f. nagariensis]|uniref:cyclin-dependent kinase n=1 Tax=Volvox carteri f. nagariensis TaxID=3068 RepID=D8TI73_VOLCA|nr:cyclin dependent kinase [Volvox carteri f. nagariensis]EFJ53187.1 cyclin dependent kinase [Volvox carteri f. nagariensis]|eukprot:XP_002946192.1 cyclin dependent kinase [Volvox carteri f. nagariensis]